MSQKLRLPNIGSKTTINGLLMPILSPISQILSDKLLLARNIESIASNIASFGVVFKYGCPKTDCQPLTILKSR